MGDNFRNRFIYVKEIQDLRWIDIAKKSGLNKAQISQYKNGVHEPEQEALYKLATALNVNVAWLMGADVPMEAKNYNEAAAKLMELFSLLNVSGQQAALKKVGDLTKLEQFIKK